jgi:hypothetical protein
MGTALIAANRPMLASLGRTVLWRPLRDAINDGSTGGTFTGPQPKDIAGLAGWWDAGTFSGLLDAGSRPLPAWNYPAAGIADNSGNGNVLAAYRFSGSTLPQGTPRLNGCLGGVGLNTVVPPNAVPQQGCCLPQMDADQGLQLATANLGSSNAWTW